MNARGLLALLLLAFVLPACGDGSTAPPAPLPTAPANLTITGKTSGRVHLAWDDLSTDETGFTIERSSDGVNWSSAGTVGPGIEAFFDRGHHPLESLRYRVRPTNNPTGFSNVVIDDLDAVSWDSAIGGGPSGRAGHSLIYDELNERLVLFGGIDDVTGWLDDAWQMDLSGAVPGAWAPLPTTGGPPTARFAHSAVYDPDGDRMIVFGGEIEPTGPTPPVIGDVWELTLPSVGTATWGPLSTTGTAPSARRGHSAVLDPTNGRMLVFAGTTLLSLTSDLRSLDLTTLAWTDHGTASFGRTDHAAIWDAANSRLVVHSGEGGTGAGAVPDTWAATVPLVGVASWSMIGGAVPFARTSPSAIYDAENRRMIVFGGVAGSGIYNDVWTLSLLPGGAWRQAAVGSPPPARLSASGAYDPVHERMLIFGGDDGTFFPIDDQAYPLLLGTP